MFQNKAITDAHKVKAIAIELGFDEVGIARAEALTEDAARLEKWLLKG
jgi:epoxyqueuosine reductase